MESEAFLLDQLVNSIGDAVEKLELAKSRNNLQEFNKIKDFIIELQKRIELEADKIRV